MAKINHYLDYTKCTLEELRGFITSRTGKKSTSRNVAYLSKKLRALDTSATFRFKDLPAEMRIAVYAELLHRPDPYVKEKIYAQILATSKQIYREAEPELTGKGRMLIHMKSEYQRICPVVIMGTQSMRLSQFKGYPARKALWELYQKFALAVVKVQNMTIDLDFGHIPHNSANGVKIAYFLFALVVALRTSKLRSLTLHVSRRSMEWETEDLLRLLGRIKSDVIISFQGVSQKTESAILSRQRRNPFKYSVVSGKHDLVLQGDLIALFPPKGFAKLGGGW